MIKKQKILKIILALIIILSAIYSSSYAAIAQVTKESLTLGFENLASVEDLEISQVNVGDNTISLIYNNQQLEMQYDLSSAPTFTMGIDVQQGMTSDEFLSENQNLGGILLGYIAIASLNNTDPNEAMLYYAFTSLESMGGITIDSSTSSQINNNIMEYVNSLYGNPQTYSDSQYGNTFQVTTELQNVTNTSCRVVSTLKVNPNGDFSKVHEYIEQVKNSFQNGQSEENTTSGGETTSTTEQNLGSQNSNNQSNSIQNNNNQNSNNNKTLETPLPKTGIGISMYIALGIVVVLIIIFGIRWISLKDVK